MYSEHSGWVASWLSLGVQNTSAPGRVTLSAQAVVHVAWNIIYLPRSCTDALYNMLAQKLVEIQLTVTSHHYLNPWILQCWEAATVRPDFLLPGSRHWPYFPLRSESLPEFLTKWFAWPSSEPNVQMFTKFALKLCLQLVSTIWGKENGLDAPRAAWDLTWMAASSVGSVPAPACPTFLLLFTLGLFSFPSCVP